MLIENNAAIKAGTTKWRGISKRLPLKRKTNKPIFRMILKKLIKIQIKHDRLIGMLFPVMVLSKR
jgi:hypothetical protein